MRQPLLAQGIFPQTASVLSCVLALSCASGGAAVGAGTSSLSYGYMVPGAQVATALGVGASDTLPELPARSTLPTLVANAITQEVAQGNWNNQCTRRFGGPTRYAVIFHRACDSSIGPEAEPMVVVGFLSDGKTAGRVRWAGPNTVTVLFPARRF